jgi:hypothetical protein
MPLGSLVRSGPRRTFKMRETHPRSLIGPLQLPNKRRQRSRSSAYWVISQLPLCSPKQSLSTLMKRCCCVFAMKKVGLRETEARPGRPCWDWICGLEYMSNTRKAHAGTLAAEIRRQKRCAEMCSTYLLIRYPRVFVPLTSCFNLSASGNICGAWRFGREDRIATASTCSINSGIGGRRGLNLPLSTRRF